MPAERRGAGAVELGLGRPVQDQGRPASAHDRRETTHRAREAVELAQAPDCRARSPRSPRRPARCGHGTVLEEHQLELERPFPGSVEDALQHRLGAARARPPGDRHEHTMAGLGGAPAPEARQTAQPAAALTPSEGSGPDRSRSGGGSAGADAGHRAGRRSMPLWRHTAGICSQRAGRPVREMRTYSDQLASAGASMEPIVSAALDARAPARRGCAVARHRLRARRSPAARLVRDRWSPAGLAGLDPIDSARRRPSARTWTSAPQIARRADGSAPAGRSGAAGRGHASTSKRRGARLREARPLIVAPGGRIVVSTPNVATLRCRLELAVRGELTPFRVDNFPHISPHPAACHPAGPRGGGPADAIRPRSPRYDVIPMTGGRTWPEPFRARLPRLTSVSVIVSAQHPA